jgi:3-oxoacyl-[acyl-carrier protein] reductase
MNPTGNNHYATVNNTMNLQGKTVLIPGASRPIGRRIARLFARKGANLVLPWFDWPESVTEMQEEFAGVDGDIFSMECDLRDHSKVKLLADGIQQRFSSLDYLINNIERGGMPVVHGSYEHEHNYEQWQLEMDTTLKAKWNLYHCMLPLLRASAGGSVVNISSIAGLTGRSGPAACFFNDGYSAANRAIQSFTQTWAREASPTIRVNEAMIGLVTGRHGDATRGWSVVSDREKQALLDHTLLDRLGTPEEIASVVYFLAVEATFMTGSVVCVDGGYILGNDRVPEMPPGIL